MSATALLLVLVGIFIILNARNFTDVIQGRAHITFVGKGERPKTSPRGNE